PAREHICSSITVSTSLGPALCDGFIAHDSSPFRTRPLFRTTPPRSARRLHVPSSSPRNYHQQPRLLLLQQRPQRCHRYGAFFYSFFLNERRCAGGGTSV